MSTDPRIFICTSAADIDSTIRCANSNGYPFDIDMLRAARQIEAERGKRSTVINLLDREINRQEKLA